jgi:chromate transporter
MKTLLQLFFIFARVGGFTFGGGYAMLPLVQAAVLEHGWLAETQIVDFIAVSESTPGPFAINIATYVGSTRGMALLGESPLGAIFGAFVATLGVVLPSFIIILIIAALIRDLLKYDAVKAFLGGIHPCVIGVIVATSVTMLLSTVFSFKSIGDMPSPDIKGIIILIFVIASDILLKKIYKKKISPIFLILISAALGIILYA